MNRRQLHFKIHQPLKMETTVSNDVQDQTYNEESMLRPTSLANVSELNDPSTDKSKMSHQIWTEYRGGRGIETPENGEEDIEDDQETTPRIKVKLLAGFIFHMYTLKNL